VVSSIGMNLKVKVHACIGGSKTSEDIQKLKEGQHIVVGTPGRVFMLMDQKHLNTNSIKVFVLDEADEMLSLGFRSQIQNIYSHLSKDCQILLLSATMPQDILEFTTKIMNDPVRILVNQEELTLDGIHQFYIDLKEEDNKYYTLIDLYKNISLSQVIVFVNTVRKVNTLQQALTDDNFTVSAIHGEMDQTARDEIMRQFRSGNSRILLATDVLARGIDVQQVSLVINYDMPNSRETYIHRIGRGGRFGRKGTAINFVTDNDKSLIQDFISYYKTSIPQMPENIMNLL
ncbi:Eukaryotic initiation factor 4A-I, partial [Cichlidogyrus casuarinus]